MPAETIRLLQVVPSLAPGGAERVAVNLLLALDRSRYELAVASLYPPAGSELEAMLAAAGIPVRYLGKRPGLDPRMWSRVARLVSEFRPDVIHCHLSTLVYVVPAAAPWGARIVYTVHSVVELSIPPPHRAFYRACFRRGWVKPVSIARAVSESLCRELKVAEPVLIANGIPVARYAEPASSRGVWRKREGFDERELLLVCVARLSPAKNHALLLEAFAACGAGDARLVLAGDGELRADLSQRATALGIERRVRFLGIRSDIPETLAACDAFVLASSAEGNPLCVQEAMAAGLPVVATAAGGIPELIRDGAEGLLVTPGNAAELTRAMTRILSDASLRGALGESARRRARGEFDVSVMTAAYDRLYREQLLRKAA